MVRGARTCQRLPTVFVYAPASLSLLSHSQGEYSLSQALWASSYPVFLSLRPVSELNYPRVSIAQAGTALGADSWDRAGIYRLVTTCAHRKTAACPVTWE